jgi:cell division transport system permease protein
MAQFGKQYSRKARPSYLYSIIGVALVLFMLGLLGIVVINAKKLSDHFKENIEVSLVLMDNCDATQAQKIKTYLDQYNFIKSSVYISKDQAYNFFKKNYQEDFKELLEYNPLYASINFHVNSVYANNDSLKKIENIFVGNKLVKEVYYQKQLVDMMNTNARKISFVIIGIIILLFFIALALIDNTIKLVMYSNRFLIKSMQMVGATRWFISKPFIFRAFLNGLLSGTIAVGLLIFVGIYANAQFEELRNLVPVSNFVLLLSMVILIGILISIWSTFRSATKYQKMKLDELY